MPRWLVQGPWQRSNRFYLNQQDGTFKEVAENMGVADTTCSTWVFFGRDKDGDLDLFVINTPLQSGPKLNDDIARDQQRRSRAMTVLETSSRTSHGTKRA